MYSSSFHSTVWLFLPLVFSTLILLFVSYCHFLSSLALSSSSSSSIILYLFFLYLFRNTGDLTAELHQRHQLPQISFDDHDIRAARKIGKGKSEKVRAKRK